VLTLSPLLEKLFPATRTNSVRAAGKLHATAEIKAGNADVLSRLEDNANPTIVAVRHGVRSPAATVRNGVGLNDPDLRFTTTRDTFDLDARFKTETGSDAVDVPLVRQKADARELSDPAAAEGMAASLNFAEQLQSISRSRMPRCVRLAGCSRQPRFVIMTML